MLFPSVELTTADGHPLLLLMDPSRTEHHIDDLLSRLDVLIDARGTDAGRSRLSVEHILDQCDENTLVIGTHVNGPGGLLEHAGQQRGEALRNRTWQQRRCIQVKTWRRTGWTGASARSDAGHPRCTLPTATASQT